ncbi:hypothetical protein ADUPG1_012121 [Aduncisulcus paluster]|uniref:Uncharacterized protein n=1 Tax=Aduncisulcus paluster TaxID=2918883 RepID=A0ABQ5JYG0_9EUKA|nr:hypothetical protein ADUPG1_012121 [Aduncisulcus paluster]
MWSWQRLADCRFGRTDGWSFDWFELDLALIVRIGPEVEVVDFFVYWLELRFEEGTLALVRIFWISSVSSSGTTALPSVKIGPEFGSRWRRPSGVKNFSWLSFNTSFHISRSLMSGRLSLIRSMGIGLLVIYMTFSFGALGLCMYLAGGKYPLVGSDLVIGLLLVLAMRALVSSSLVLSSTLMTEWCKMRSSYKWPTRKSISNGALFL